MKYPRTHHIVYSQKASDDDKRVDNDSHFKGKKVIGTIKMDGENTSIYTDKSHARSENSLVDSEDRRWIETLRQTKLYDLPSNIRICGENLFYKHTVEYNNLESMFYAFSVWDEEKCLSWSESVKIFNEYGLTHVPVFYEGEYDKDKILKAFDKWCEENPNTEGFVIRLEEEFLYDDFKYSLNKFVRDTFIINTPKHWRYTQKELNKLKDDKNPWQ